MMTPEQLRDKVVGPYVVTLTPFDRALRVDDGGLRTNTRYLIDCGIVSGAGVLCPTGSTGECYVLDNEERRRVWEVVLDEAAGRVPVVAGCNLPGTDHVIELVKLAQEVGVDGVMILPPYYWPPEHADIVAHFKAISDATELGIVVYNNVWITQHDFSLETLEALAGIENIVALKDCTKDFKRLIDAVALAHDHYNVINCADGLEVFGYMRGCSGFITTYGNFLGEWAVQMHQAGKAGDMDEAMRLAAWVRPLQDIINSVKRTRGEAQAISCWKACMDMVGLAGGALRLPHLPVDKDLRQALERTLRKMGKL
jgi:dihydrodipicolinate synthase/N-acetylneuraminate lyase